MNIASVNATIDGPCLGFRDVLNYHDSVHLRSTLWSSLRLKRESVLEILAS
jgi:hypothetical protein